MYKNLIQHNLRIAIVLIIFLLYLMNGIGALDISFQNGLDVNFNFRILASILSSTLNNPLSLQSISLLVMLITGVVLACVLPLLTPVFASLLTLTTCIPHVYLYFFNTRSQLVLPMEYSLLIILVLYTLNALISYFIETHSKQKIINLFAQYVPPEVARKLSRHPDKVNLEGESRKLSVFFCDLQDFSNVAEQLNPKQLTLLLNEYFDDMTEILYRYGATIDKYIGDSIMAFWGAPIAQDDHAERAIFAAFDMHDRIKNLSESFIRRGWPGPSMGIGINTGIMNVGNMGSRYRITYTVIGDAVNLAARVESLTRKYQVPILVSEGTKKECQNIIFREIDTVKVKGKHNQTRIFQPLCRRSDLTEQTEQSLEKHALAIKAYAANDTKLARDLFKELLDANPDDGFYSSMLTRLDS